MTIGFISTGKKEDLGNTKNFIIKVYRKRDAEETR